MEKSSGIAIIHDKKILMTHSTNSPWYKSWMPPKGKIEPGETEEEAACREVEEECGIRIDPKNLGKKHTIEYKKFKTGKKYKEAYIFEFHIKDLSEIGVPNLIKGEIPKFMLQEEEIESARFMGYDECKTRALPRYIPMIEEIFESIYKKN